MTISVALCTYNGEKYIKEQIDSILQQTLNVNEIIVCDDQSTDNTVTVLNQYSIEHPDLFKIYCNDINLRSVKNFEKAISLCTGDIIFLSDQDDIWVTNKVEKYIEHFNKKQYIQVIASNGYCIDENSKVTEMYAIWDVPEFLREQNITFNYFELITYISNIATGASMAFRKEILREVLPFPIIENFHHDEWIAIISANKKAFELLNEKYFYYRKHENQQVGGVFFKKTQQSKELLTNIFNIHHNDFTFLNYKKRLKKLISAYKRNEKMFLYNTYNNLIFNNNLVSIKNLIFNTKIEMKKKYPLKTFLLGISDNLFKKRQFKS